MNTVMSLTSLFSADRRAAKNSTGADEPKSAAAGYSDAFAWANLKFDKLFTFPEKTCANKYLKDFWATTGTFVTTLLIAGALRTILDFLLRKVFEYVSGNRPTDPVKGAEPGAYELHIVKTAHLGLCQATGALICGMNFRKPASD